MSNEPVAHERLYQEILAEFCKTHSEESLYRASLLSGTLIDNGLGPDEIVALHYESMQAASSDDSLPPTERIRVLNDAHQFLLEVMIAYGTQYKEFLELKLADATRRAEHAELGQREKLEILGMIAHELGNPLTVALGNMQLAVKFIDTQDLTNLREVVGESRDALQRLAAVTGQLVAVSKGQELPLELEPINVCRLAERVKAQIQRIADTKDITIDCHAGEGLLVLGDEEGLSSIMTNLLSNAVRYTPGRGTIRFSVAGDGDSVIVEVADNGVGMPRETVQRIFEQFYRSDDARRLDPKGLGMGLAIVQRLVAAHNGTIEVESSPGNGSSFRVALPRYEEAV